MKKKMLLTLVSFFALQFLIAQTTQLLPLYIRETAAQHGLDIFMHPQVSNVSVTIKNNEYVVILSESIPAQQELQKRYNFKSIEEGDYSIVLESSEWRYEHRFTKKGNQILINDEDIDYLIYPKWAVMSDKIIVPIQDANNVVPLGLTVYDQRGREVYAYKLTEKSHQTGVKFDLSNLASGNYDVALETDTKTITKSFSKD